MFILHCQRPLWDAFDLSWQQTSLYKAPSFKYCHVATCCPCTQSAPPREARPPTRFRASKTAQRNLGFWSFKRKAHAKPAKPAPTTTTSTCAQGPGENKKKNTKDLGLKWFETSKVIRVCMGFWLDSGLKSSDARYKWNSICIQMYGIQRCQDINPYSNALQPFWGKICTVLFQLVKPGPKEATAYQNCHKMGGQLCLLSGWWKKFKAAARHGGRCNLYKECSFFDFLRCTLRSPRFVVMSHDSFVKSS